MGLTAYPNGVSSFGMPILGASGAMTTGNIFFVDSGGTGRADDASSGKSPANPFVTLDFAIGQCTANNGDIIFLMPGHAENIGASDVVMDVAGVSVLGLGHGNDRPTFTLDNAGSSIVMGALTASTRLSNVILSPGAASIVRAINLNGSACEVDNVEFTTHATNEFLVLIGCQGNNCIIRDCVLNSLDGAGAATGIELNGCDRVLVTRNIIQGDFSTGAIENATASALQATITHNIITNQSTSGTITMLATATGTLAHNALSNRTTGLGTDVFVPGDCLCVENYYVNDEDEANVIIPTTPST